MLRRHEYCQQVNNNNKNVCVCVSADINECSSLTKPCSSGFNCINTVGSYTCQQKVIKCNQGHQASPDGTKCVGEVSLLNTHTTNTVYVCILYIETLHFKSHISVSTYLCSTLCMLCNYLHSVQNWTG